MKTTASALLCAALSTTLASADVITWGPVQNATAASDVSTNGTLVTARNCWANVFANPTVNGVFFDAFAPIGWTNGGWSLNAGSTTGDVDYDAMLDSARVTSFGTSGNPTGVGAIRLDTLGTLEVGKSYEIQVWYSDQRTGTPTNVLYDRQMTLGSAAGVGGDVQGGEIQNLAQLTQGPNSGLLDADPNNTAGAGDTIVGTFCIGTFDRTSTDELYLLVTGTHPLSNNVLRPHINAFQIREVSGVLGQNYCSANPNSTGATGTMGASGQASAAANNLTLTASNLPPSQFGIFVVSRTQGFVPNAGGTSNGNLCLSGNLGRYSQPSQILSTGAGGNFALMIDLTAIPQGAGTVAVAAGETWNFQAWHRDGVGLGSNFTDGLSVTFQ